VFKESEDYGRRRKSNVYARYLLSTWAAKQSAFVCEHLVHGEANGFFFDEEEECLYPDAWCRVCERLRVESGGEWTEALKNRANIQIVCVDCYQEIRQRNTGLVN
jgi:hypothetical protein